MAEIPVEKKSGIPAWLWLLLLAILVALLIWWLTDDDDAEIAAVEEPIIEEEFEPIDDDFAVAGPITTMAGLTALATSVGNDVDLDNVTVTSLAGDMAFYIGEGANRTLVVFDQVPTPGDATEGRYDINAGSVLSLEGEVRQDDGTLAQGVDADIPADTQYYIFADDIEMQN